MIKNAISAPRPLYPADHAHGTDGTVVLQITISKQGDVTSTRTVSGPVELRAAAVQAVRTWRFRPYLLSGNPVDVETTMELPFKPQ
jgi:periplasmic protein TonB